MSPTTLIVVPVLNRTQNIAPLIRSVETATPEPHRLLFVVDETDRAELAALRDIGADTLVVPRTHISYPHKVNAAYLATSEPLLFLAADDVRFHPGWLTAATAKLSATVAVVGTNDLGNARTIDGTHSTHTLVTRAYCDDPGGAHGEPGSVMHAGYSHWFCDDELVGLAQARGVYAAATDSVVEHMHPYHAKAARDATYARGERRRAQDRRLHNKRARLWT
jgi:glycosyltransferase involved in cell wall biosynthesis